ncbi:hypothetical protein GCM10023189_44800 [Nibrella saemangeumensis]|uniref:Uncharacterized protein n=1 Tax=Nibrella saemangeumensis TaxID=1084526 RepID=A0ABP8NFB0_9BACT
MGNYLRPVRGQNVMLTIQSTPLGMGVRLSGKAGQLNLLGDQFIQLGLTHPNEAIGQLIATFGHELKPARHPRSTTGTHSCRISWPRWLYLVHILQQLSPSLPDLSLEKQALAVLIQRSKEELRHWQTKCRMPISHFVDSSLPLYQGEFSEGLLLMAETAFVRHRPVGDRVNFLGTCLDMLSPSAWIHHDTLAFVKSIADNSWHMHILRSDLAADFSAKRW